MRRFVAIILTLVLVIGLCSCGKEPEVEKVRECGLYITVEADDIYAVSYGTEEGSESCENADKTALKAGEVIHFDFAGDAAVGTEKAIFDYTVCVYDKELNILASESFSSDFSNMAKVELTVTADHRILNDGDKLVCGGDTIVDISKDKPAKSVSLSVVNVSMPNRSDAAKAINDNIASLNEKFSGKELESYRKTYKANVADAGDDAEVGEFSMERTLSVTRGDTAVLSMRMFDKINLGIEWAAAITGHNFNAYDGSELKLSDIASDEEKFINACAEDILVSTTEYSEIIYNEGYTDTVKDLISDGHWYLNDEGIIIAVNPGEITDASLGCFEFCVTYDIIAPYMKAEYMPAELEGDSGDISAELAKGSDSSSLTIVGNDIDKDKGGALVSVSGKIYNVSVYSANYKSSGKYTLGSQLWYCSDLAEGAAFAINSQLKKTPNIFIGFTRPDGTYERRLLSLDSDGKVSITDPDGGEKGTLISEKLPYTTDLNGDETQEKISAVSNEDGIYYIQVESGGELFSKESSISKNLRIRLYDIDGNGTREIFVYGKNADGNAVTHCYTFDGELKSVSFGDDEYVAGSVKEFEENLLRVSQSVDILGSYTAEVDYKYADNSFKKSSDAMKLSGTKYVTTAKDLPLSDGKIIPADYKLKFLETDGSSYISFTTDGGLKGKIEIKKSDSGWTIDGAKDTSYFDSLPYDK